MCGASFTAGCLERGAGCEDITVVFKGLVDRHVVMDLVQTAQSWSLLDHCVY